MAWLKVVLGRLACEHDSDDDNSWGKGNMDFDPSPTGSTSPSIQAALHYPGASGGLGVSFKWKRFRFALQTGPLLVAVNFRRKSAGKQTRFVLH